MSTIAFQGPLNWTGYLFLQKRLFTEIVRQESKEVRIDLAGVERVYPNGAVPLIVLLEGYRRQGVAVRVDGAQIHPAMLSHDYLALLDPSAGVAPRLGPSAVHVFHDDVEVNELINQKIHQVLGQAQYAPGVLPAFEWFLNEIAGNVLVHAEGQRGWMQVVVHPSTQHLSVIVADDGMGIPESIRSSALLRERFGDRVDDGEAIEIALREGVTSKPDFGQGKGLAGTIAIVKANPGATMSITSRQGRVSYSLEEGLKVRDHQPPLAGTLVDVQLDFSKPIEIEKALWGHVPVNFTEMLYGKDLPVGVMRLSLCDEAPSFGNRITATRIRTKIENLLATAPADVLEIDFHGVSILASSFADEVFGKLAAKLGIIGFSRRLRFLNLNAFCQGVIDDVVQARLAQNYASKNGPTNE
ncbi:DUF4325 domain-containing protein [Acidovorax sp. GBBC 3334]|uniref:STAS-like domain-containing protein n=1 Tax=unclassified Acidovorax TaxID=2684926 RepID=UPI0023022DEA|nr:MULTISPECIES: DUF4325 domain-containing protein [unclassified Acidovorax]MDA8453486.1 DUF4325 domain-containing protein [Acidovorax sp. GBBC 3334]MDA8522524.1 DUF4325 domain-containing protein [Acidovorax sp. NCPPB 4044]